MQYQPIDHYVAPPLRETPAHKRADHIQQEINLMRAIYARQLDNQARRDAMMGWSLVVVALAVPAIVAASILFF